MPFQKFLLFVVYALTISSCKFPEKLNKEVENHYNSYVPKTEVINSSNVKITDQAPNKVFGVSEAFLKERKFLFYVVYSKEWNQVNVNLNHNFLNNNLYKTLNKNISSINEKLGTKQLVLTINSIPTNFGFKTTTYGFFILLNHTNRRIIPETNNLSIDYKVLDNQTIVKQGKIIIDQPIETYKVKFFQNYKKAVKQYLENYDMATMQMASQFASKLNNEL